MVLSLRPRINYINLDDVAIAIEVASWLSLMKLMKNYQDLYFTSLLCKFDSTS